jgi:hypothetical protein
MNETDDHSLLGNTLGADTPDFLGGNLNFKNPRSANVTTGIPYFNTSIFAPSAIGLEGSANRAFFHGPGFNQFDMSLLKDTKLTSVPSSSTFSITPNSLTPVETLLLDHQALVSLTQLVLAALARLL